MMIYRANGKKWTLPDVLLFGGSPQFGFGGKWMSYTVEGPRKPLKGEWYLSGAIIQPWEAPGDLGTEFLIAIPNKEMKRKTIWVAKDD